MENGERRGKNGEVEGERCIRECLFFGFPFDRSFFELGDIFYLYTPPLYSDHLARCAFSVHLSFHYLLPLARRIYEEDV